MNRSSGFLLGYARSWGSWRRAFASLHEPQYRRYLRANFVSVAGTWMQRIGQDWLVLEMTDSALALGVTLAMQFLPIMLGAVWAGGVVDRSDLRRVLLRTHAAMAVLAVGLASLTWTGVVELWMVWAFAFTLGVVEVFDNPARHKLISRLVDRQNVANAVGLHSASYNVGRLVGPSVAGAIIAVGGVPMAFLGNSLSFLPMYLVVRGLRVPGHGREEAATSTTARSAVRYVLSHATVRRSLGLMFVVSMFSHSFRVMLPLLVVQRFSGGAGLYGTLLACMGVGSLFGGMGAATAGMPSVRRLLGAATCFGALVLLVAPAQSFLLLAAVLVVVGTSNTFFNVTARSLELLASDELYRARVMSAHQVVFVGTTPLGALLLGWIAEVGGPSTAFLVAGSIVLAAVAVSTSLGHRNSPGIVET